MSGKNDCSHDKDEVSVGRSDTISWAISKLPVSSSSTEREDVKTSVCTKVDRCDFAREEAISRFTTLRKKIENTNYTGLWERIKEGGTSSSALSKPLKSELKKFEHQSGELPSKLHRLDLTESELIDLWEDSKKLEDAIEELERQSLDEDQWPTEKFRGKPVFDNVPKQVQDVTSVKDIVGNVQDQTEQELKEEHSVSKNELEKRVNSKRGTESETENQGQEQEREPEKGTEERQQHRR